MRALLNFDDWNDGYRISFLAEDCKITLMTYRHVKDAATLLRIIGKLHGDVDAAVYQIKQWGRGGVWVELSPAQRKYFGIQ